MTASNEVSLSHPCLDAPGSIHEQWFALPNLSRHAERSRHRFVRCQRILLRLVLVGMFDVISEVTLDLAGEFAERLADLRHGLIDLVA